MTTPQILQQLERFRLEHDWSYDQLAAEVASVTNVRRHGTSYRRAIEGEVQIRKTTLHAIRRFLDVRQNGVGQRTSR